MGESINISRVLSCYFTGKKNNSFLRIPSNSESKARERFKVRQVLNIRVPGIQWLEVCKILFHFMFPYYKHDQDDI